MTIRKAIKPFRVIDSNINAFCVLFGISGLLCGLKLEAVELRAYFCQAFDKLTYSLALINPLKASYNRKKISVSI